MLRLGLNRTPSARRCGKFRIQNSKFKIQNYPTPQVSSLHPFRRSPAVAEALASMGATEDDTALLRDTARALHDLSGVD